VKLVRRLGALWRNLVRREQVERELDDELAGYVELLTDERVRRGMPRAAARREALIEVGGVQHVKTRVREVRAGAHFEAIVHDVRYAWRGLRRAPGFTAIAIVTLALGIGANTSIFSIVDAVLLRPLPFRDPAQLVRVYERMGAEPRGEVSAHEYLAWRDQNRSLSGLSIFTWSNPNLTGDGEPRSITAMEVSANFFGVEGVTPVIGRGFVAGEDTRGAHKVAVLTSSLWRSRYGADSTIVGRSILLDGNAVTVVGVMPPLEGLEPDLWVPMNVEEEAIRVGRHSHYVVGRLRPGGTIEAATRDLVAISAELAKRLPDNTGHSAWVTSQYQDTIEGVRRPILVALAAVACVLLIGCANVAHLMLQRASGRQREVAVRIALGASRGRVIQQMLTESILLSMLGAAVGVVLAIWVVRLLPSLDAVRIPRLSTVGVDGRVLVATLGLSLVTGMVSGVAPALRATRPALRQWMGEGARSGSVSGRLGGAFVVSEVALAVLLLIGAALLVQSFARLVRVDPGFDPRGVLAVDLSLPPSRYSTPNSIVESYDALRARMAALPGVRAVAAASTVPLGGCCNNMPLSIEGRPPAPRGQSETAVLSIVTPGYFSTMGIRLLRGRDFSDADARLSLPLIRYWEEQPQPPRVGEPQPAPVAVISETMARQYWPNVSPIGKRFRVLFSPWVTVVGVVADVKHMTLGGPAPADLYLANAQEPYGALLLVLKTDGDPMALAPLARAQVRAYDKDLPVNGIASMEQVLNRSVGRPRFNAMLIGVFGGIALLLSLVGTYGVMSYGVAQRTHEIGVRTALGAQVTDVVHLILGRTLRLTGVGLAIGIAGALVLTRVLEGMLYDVAPTDARTFLAVALLLALTSLLAGYVPTRRALRIDPAIALRNA
jgi:putative ABC transport system permease protein